MRVKVFLSLSSLFGLFRYALGISVLAGYGVGFILSLCAPYFILFSTFLLYPYFHHNPQSVSHYWPYIALLHRKL